MCLYAPPRHDGTLWDGLAPQGTQAPATLCSLQGPPQDLCPLPGEALTFPAVHYQLEGFHQGILRSGHSLTDVATRTRARQDHAGPGGAQAAPGRRQRRRGRGQ